MNIVEPYAKILFPDNKERGIDLLSHIEWCGRISHRAEDKQTEDSWQRFIRSVVLDHGDWSIVEHSTACVEFYVDRGITHEIVRHRLFSYTQESTRFVNYEKKMPPSFILPSLELSKDAREAWNESIQESAETYKVMLLEGCSPQLARSVFPNALASKLIMTGNLRSWRHFLIMRTTKETHPQMRQVTIPLLEQFKERIPILYDDIEPLQKQSEALKKGR